MTKNFEHPQQEIVRIVFDATMTPWELAERVHRVKKGSRIDVIIPPDHLVLLSAVAVEYMGRALAMQEGVTVVCGDKEIRLQLKRTGVAVRSGEVMQEYAAGAGRQFEEWAKGESSMPRGRRNKFFPKTYLIGAGVFAVVVLFLFSTILPQAEVVIIGETREVERSARFVADAGWREAHTDVHRIRGMRESADAIVTLRVPITEMSESGGFARGMFTFENQTGNEVPITPETRLVSEDGIVYLVDAPVTIPPAIVAEDLSVTFGTAIAAAHAQLPGENGNRQGGRLTITTLPPQRQSRVYARIETPFTEGTNRLGKVVSDAHVTQALPQAQEELRGMLARALIDKVGEDWWAIPELSMATTTNVDVSPTVGNEADEMTLTVRGVITAVLLMREDLMRLFELSERDCIADRCQIAAPSVKTFDQAKGIAEGELRLTRKLVPVIHEEELARTIAGKSVQDARHIVLTTPQVKDARIHVRRSIRSFLPRDPNKIKILIE